MTDDSASGSPAPLGDDGPHDGLPDGLPGGRSDARASHSADDRAGAAASGARRCDATCGEGSCAAAAGRMRERASRAAAPLHLDQLAELLPRLDTAIAMTGNGVALLSETGTYAPPSATGGAHPHHPAHVNLRFDTRSVVALLSTESRAAEHQPASIDVIDSVGETVHRSYLFDETDLLTAASHCLSPLGLSSFALSNVQESAAAAPLAGWDSADQLSHLDSIIVDCGVARRGTFARASDEHCRPMEVDVLPLLLDWLCQSGLPVTVAVPTSGCVQWHHGPLDLVDPSGGALRVVSGSATLAVDLAFVREAFVVTAPGVHGDTSTVELYDASGRCVALLTQFGLVGDEVAAEWERIATSLPA